jgi:hypothetical protein
MTKSRLTSTPLSSPVGVKLVAVGADVQRGSGQRSTDANTMFTGVSPAATGAGPALHRSGYEPRVLTTPRNDARRGEAGDRLPDTPVSIDMACGTRAAKSGNSGTKRSETTSSQLGHPSANASLAGAAERVDRRQGLTPVASTRPFVLTMGRAAPLSNGRLQDAVSPQVNLPLRSSEARRTGRGEGRNLAQTGSVDVGLAAAPGGEIPAEVAKYGADNATCMSTAPVTRGVLAKNAPSVTRSSNPPWPGVITGKQSTEQTLAGPSGGPALPSMQSSADTTAASLARAGPTEGDVYLDGTLVGRWMVRNLAQAAGRPASGGSAFDPTRGRLPLGTMIGG